MPAPFNDVAALTVELLAAAGQPDAHIYPPAGDRRDYVSAPRVLDLAVRFEAAVIKAFDAYQAIEREADEWAEICGDLIATNDRLLRQANFLSHHNDELLAEAVRQHLKADDLTAALSESRDSLEHLANRLVTLRHDLRDLLARHGVDTDDLDECDLMPELADLIERLKAPKPRRSFLWGMFGR